MFSEQTDLTAYEREEKNKLYYGYWVAAACFAIQGIGIGSFISFGVFFKPLLAEFGWSRAVVSGASSVTFLFSGILGIFVGSLNDRFGPRVLMSVTGGLFGLGYLLMSQVSTLWQLYFFLGVVIGMGTSSIDVIPLTTTARWFVSKRGMMTGMVKVGTGAGQLTIPLMAGLLISAYGWRTAYISMGALVLVLLVSISQLLRRDPSQMGLPPDGTEEATATETGQTIGLRLREAMGTRQFWIICLVNLTVIYCLLTVMMHIVPHAIDIGFSPIKAAGILSTIGGVSMVGRLVIGIAIDRIGNKRSMTICFLILIASLLWLQAASELWMLYLFAAIYGLAHGGFFTVISPIVAELFGIGSHGVLFGVVGFSGTVGGAIGPFLAGHIFDITSSYQLVFFILIGVSIAGLILISLLKPAFKGA
jgi:MFS family permease